MKETRFITDAEVDSLTWDDTKDGYYNTDSARIHLKIHVKQKAKRGGS